MARPRGSAGEQACKPGSVRRDTWAASTGAAVISLGPPVARGLKRPTRGSAGRLISPYLALLRVGFAWPVCRQTAGGLLPRRCTLTGRTKPTGGMFLWHYPWGRPRWELPSTLPFGARTFLDACAPRPPGLLPETW